MSFFEIKAEAHLVAALVKEFFMRLPQPLLTYSLYRSFILWTGRHFKVHLLIKDVDDPGYQHSAMHSLIFSLPPTNRAVLVYLVSFFDNILKHADKNKATIEAIAKLYGPILLRPPGEL